MFIVKIVTALYFAMLFNGLFLSMKYAKNSLLDMGTLKSIFCKQKHHEVL